MARKKGRCERSGNDQPMASTETAQKLGERFGKRST
jgi:hypothetical protein